MHYTIYKITNQINGKYYIGKHQTKNLDDGYMGSGKILKMAIAKYGIENFKKEILHVFDNEDDMNDKERELVVVNESTYNLNEGGMGGFGYINRNNLRKPLSDKSKSTISFKVKDLWKNSNVYDGTMRSLENSRSVKRKSNFSINDQVRRKALDLSKSASAALKRKHTLQTLNHQQGERNSQFNTLWINDGQQNKKVSKEDFCLYSNKGWKKGRINVKSPSTSGMCWITNGVESKMIKGTELPSGWYKGRKM